MNSIITFLILLVLGYFLKVIGFMSKTDGDAIRKFVFNVCLPCMTFQAMQSTDLNATFLLILVLVALLHVIGYIFFRYSGKSAKDVIFVGWAGNTAFIGYPVVEGLLGLAGLSRAVVFDQANTIMIILLWMQKGVRSILSPPLVGAVLGLLLHGINVPLPLSDAISVLAKATSPLAMIYTGYVLNLEWDLRVLPAIVVKFIVLPLLAWGIALLLKLPPLDMQVVVLQSSMPTMVVSIIYGEQMGLDTSFLSKSVVLSTLLYPLSFILWKTIL
jgi:predicted permease